MKPAIFALETSLACDLKCPECAIGGGMIDRKKGFLSFERFKIVADKIRPYAEFLYLHLWGEPMLNPAILDMTRYASAFVPTNISTNGQTMTPAMADDLITSGVSEILVSIDGVSQEIYKRYRVGGDVRKALGALEMLAASNASHGGKVRLHPQFIVFRHNRHEMDAFARTCAGLGLAPSFKAPYIRRSDSNIGYSDLPEYQRPRYPDFPSLRHAMRGCGNARNVFTMLLDGSVVACCHDYGKGTRFGNLFEQGVMEIWDSPAYRNFREAVLSGNAPAFCVENCMSYFLETAHPSGPSTVAPAPEPVNPPVKVNLCSGPVRLEGYVNIDASPASEVVRDLERELLPFADGQVDTLVCMSAINYFTRERGQRIVDDVFRVLRPGGVARFGTQDLHVLAERYLSEDRGFYFEKLPDGRDRYPGETVADKFNEFFYGFRAGDNHCKYVYDYPALAVLFRKAGFARIEKRSYLESRIPGIESIDNRPEQMFYLEAVKGTPLLPGMRSETESLLGEIRGTLSRGGRPAESDSPAAVARRLAASYLAGGDAERGWQQLLDALSIDPGDRESMARCAGILLDAGRIEDLVALLSAFLQASPGDQEVSEALAEALEQQRTGNAAKTAPLASRRKALERLDHPPGKILSDREHLDACIRWLSLAQDANGRGGVSAVYSMDSLRWDVDYPETTGYIIPTFLAFHHLTGSAEALKRAIAMGDWEVAIQSPEGGAGEPVGVYGLRPRVFNTGQVLLGWIALYKETQDDRYLTAALRAADWIVACQDPDGKWTRSTYKGPRAYKSRVAWALLELFAVTGDDRYRISAERAVRWVLSQSQDNGWFDANSLSEPGKPWTHLIGYVLVGLQEILRLGNADVDHDRIGTLLRNAADGIAGFYLDAKQAAGESRFVTMPATFDRDWRSADAWSCVTGSAQLAWFLRGGARRDGSPRHARASELLIGDLKRMQYMTATGDANRLGGLPGDWPVGSGYCPWSIPNWGVKFHADALLQRLLPEARLACLS